VKLGRDVQTQASGARDTGGVQVIQRAAEILRALQDHPDGLSLSQISQRVGLARSTVHRIVSALEAESFVVAASPNGRFRLGPGLGALAASTNRDLVVDVHPFLVRLSRETNETVDLAVLEHDQVLFVDHIAAPRRLRAVSAIGATFPAHCTANGKALLATMSEETVARLLPAKLEPLTPKTITDRTRLLRELEEVRSTGVAYDREEHTLGICAVGTTVHAAGGRVAAVTVPLPAQRFYGNEASLIGTLLRTRDQINRTLSN
jgi:DNA-binding IclR family transcriptional regulator